MKIIFILIFFSLGLIGQGQNSLTDLLSAHNSETIPYISVQELAMPKTDVVILDVREPKEFNVSHIKNAIAVGYSDFKIEDVKRKIPDTSEYIVVYCSVGIRSETIAEKLKNAGYTNIYNLFGGIFEWKNKGFPVFDLDGNETDNVHTYSEHWSKWLNKGTKIYD